MLLNQTPIYHYTVDAILRELPFFFSRPDIGALIVAD